MIVNWGYRWVVLKLNRGNFKICHTFTLAWMCTAAVPIAGRGWSAIYYFRLRHLEFTFTFRLLFWSLQWDRDGYFDSHRVTIILFLMWRSYLNLQILNQILLTLILLFLGGYYSASWSAFCSIIMLGLLMVTGCWVYGSPISGILLKWDACALLKAIICECVLSDLCCTEYLEIVVVVVLVFGLYFWCVQRLLVCQGELQLI